MTRRLRSILFAVVFVIPISTFAGVKDIRTEKLPNSLAVRTAYGDVGEIEEYVRVWSPEWRYAIPKTKVAARLRASLAALKEALNSNSDNEELLLLTGLVAHYAHNVDIEGAFDLAVSSLEKAQKLAPTDYRADWFLAAHKCESSQVMEGMEKFLSVEDALRWQQLSPGFWDDYINCGLLANMPAHVLRAGGYAARLKAAPSKDRDFLLDLARKRFATPDPAATHGSREVWWAENRGSKTLFTSTMFGISFASAGSWKAKLADVNKGIGLVQFQTDPHPGKSGQVYPNILVIVRQPKPGEGLADFSQSFFNGKPAKPFVLTDCPVQDCLSAEVVEPAGYKAEDDAHFLVTVFKREEPEFPGLLFEMPSGPPASDNSQTQYSRATERFRRLDGTLYYLIALDAADSVLEKAQQEYQAFLKSIQVE